MTHHSGRGKSSYKTSDHALVVGYPLGRSTWNHDRQLVQKRKRQREPDCMQFVSQFFLSALATNELSQSVEFLCATALDSARIVKNVTRMIGKHKFVVDDVLASLSTMSMDNEEKYDDH